jgi:RHS repeat-associated protein
MRRDPRSVVVALVLALLVGGCTAVALGALRGPARSLHLTQSLAAAHNVRLAERPRLSARQLARFQHEAAVRTDWLRSPRARIQRLRSRLAYRHLSAATAGRLEIRQFGQAFGGGDATPAENPAVAGHVLHYLNAHEAVIASGRGRQRLALSSVPLLAATHSRRPAPVDLTLREAPKGLAPANPLEPVLIGSRLASGVSVGRSGLRLTLEGADVTARKLGPSTALYANVAPDTDAEVTPTSLGADFYTTLRSPASPEHLRYSVTLPRGASLEETHGLVEIVRDRKALATIASPVAADAQGSAVPVTMHVMGSHLALIVSHRRNAFAYPILVDPTVTLSSEEGGWTESGPNLLGNQYGQFSNTDPYFISAKGGVCYESASTSPPCGSGSGNADGVTWTWQSGTTLSASSVTGGAAWTFYNVSLSGLDTNNWVSAGMDISECSGDSLRGELSAGHGTSVQYGQYSFTDGIGSCPSGVRPIFVNQVLVGGPGYAAGPTTSAIGSFLVTYTCSTTCVAAGPNGYGASGGSSCGAWPVNCATGNQFEVETDLSIPGRGLGLALTRTYNSQAAAQGQSGPFGAGWSSSFSDSLSINQSAGLATVTEANGVAVPFTIVGTSYMAPWWTHATLVKNGDGTYTFTLPNQDSFHFSAGGQLTSEADRNGESDTVGYDAQNRLSTITDPAGRTITLTYNAGGNVASAADSAGRTISYSYAGGNLTSVTAADGGVWQFGYDGSHQLTSEIDPRNHTVSTLYNASNQVSSQTDPANRTRTWTYSAGETVIHNPDGTQTDEHFNGQLLTSITHAYGTSLATTTSFAYDGHGDLAAVTDPDGHTTSYVYDSAGNRLRATDPLNRVTKWTYDSLSDVTSFTEPAGVTTSFTYDAHGNLMSAATPLTGTGQTRTTTYTRANASHPGDLTALTDPNGKTTAFAYDSAGDLASMTDPLGNKTTYGYDSIGRLTSMVSPRGNAGGANPASFTTNYTYDPASRLKSETDPLGGAQSWSYDGDGNLISYTDADNRTTGYMYDADNELTTITRPDNTILRNGYDSAGNLTSQTDGSGHITTYGYNALERLTSVSDPLLRATSLGYDATGNVQSTTDPLNRTTSYGYDASNELTSICYSTCPSSPDVTYSYDADGRRTAMTDSTGSSGYVYDSLGRLKSTTDGAGNSVGYGYDLAGDATTITYPGTKLLTRAFDDDERLKSVTDWQGNVTSFDYGPDSNLKTVTFPSATGNVDTYTYDNADRISGIQMAAGTSTLASLSYTRAASGSLSSAAETGMPQPASQGTRAYAYDNADNATELAGNSGYTYDNADELTGAPGYSYAYDQLGERTAATPTGGAASTYAYNQAGRLTTYTPATGSATTFGYNGDGLRVSATTGSTTSHFTWDQTSSLPLSLTDGTNSYIYGPNGVPVEQVSQSGAPSYLHQDQLGSTRMITDQSGFVTGGFTYGAYGAMAATSGSAATPVGYAGQYTDTTTGLQYDRARYYDPATGQFMTRDPLTAVTRSPYGYALESPTNYVDPSGMCIIFSCSTWNGIGDAAAGFGDTVTFGLTSTLRQELGIDNVDYCSSAYHGGGIGGAVVGGVAVGEGVTGLALTTGLRAVPAGIAGGVSGGEAETVWGSGGHPTGTELLVGGFGGLWGASVGAVARAGIGESPLNDAFNSVIWGVGGSVVGHATQDIVTNVTGSGSASVSCDCG